MINLWQNYGKNTQKVVKICNVQYGIDWPRFRINKELKLAGE